MDYVFITSISRLSAERKEISYNQGRVQAAQTSEACCKYLMSRGLRPRIIIALCTKDAIEAKVGAAYLKAFPHLEGKYSFHLCESADGVTI